MKIGVIILSSLIIPSTAITLLAYDFSGKNYQGTTEKTMIKSEGFKESHHLSLPYVIDLISDKSLLLKKGSLPKEAFLKDYRSSRPLKNFNKGPSATSVPSSTASYNFKTTPGLVAVEMLPPQEFKENSSFSDFQSLPPQLKEENLPKTESFFTEDEDNPEAVYEDVMNEVSNPIDGVQPPQLNNKNPLRNANIGEVSVASTRKKMVTDEMKKIPNNLELNFDQFPEKESFKKSEEKSHDKNAATDSRVLRGAKNPRSPLSATVGISQSRAKGQKFENSCFLEPLDIIISNSIERFPQAFKKNLLQKTITVDKAIQYVGKARLKGLKEESVDALLCLIIDMCDDLSVTTLVDLVHAQHLKESEKRSLLVRSLLTKNKSIGEVTEAILDFSHNKSTQAKIFSEYSQSYKGDVKDLEKTHFSTNIQLLYNLLAQHNTVRVDASGNAMFLYNSTFNSFASRLFINLENDDAHNFIREYILQPSLEQFPKKTGEIFGAFFAKVCMLGKEELEKEEDFDQNDFYGYASDLAKEYIFNNVTKDPFKKKIGIPFFKKDFLDRLWKDSTEDQYGTKRCFSHKTKEEFQNDFLS